MSLLSRVVSKIVNSKTKAEEKPMQQSVSPPNPQEFLTYLSAIASVLKEALVVLDTKQTIILANKAAQELTGYSETELLGKAVDKLLTFTTSDNQVVSSDKFCGGAIYYSTGSVTLTGKSEHQVKITMGTTPINQGQSAGLGCALLIWDEGKEKVFEEMQVDFVSMASHELRTPLTSIINYLSVLDSEIKEKLDKEHQEFLNRSLGSAKDLLALVENLLSVSHIERGSTYMKFSPLSWKDKLTQITKDNQAQATQKNISLKLELPKEELPQVLADNIRVNEVLNNLISNALKHTKSAGWIKVIASIKGNEVITEVVDNGEGIPKDAMPHLFTKFYRAPGSLQKGDQSTGLGLYISKSIIDMHHGKIWAESSVGKGTHVYFSLPIAPKTPEISIAQLKNK